ncbi:hypothetical protein ACPOL_4636 [Acidisarcina polymorpha]|uniref:Uncharacterized protein n=1 Tax=Acidisarcina polymorpha TaxID=2211140 RepID=A0A2Z5G475_9BACT|nr:hypothetical protein [Acidisarcina polymorpha]AXC13908.1 hypothetical protein ACPOL_4636 [Acidisarcina polymorpha]
MRNHDLPQARGELARKSLELFAQAWKVQGHVHEHYNGATGNGDDVANSDRFYHRGTLLD